MHVFVYCTIEPQMVAHRPSPARKSQMSGPCKPTGIYRQVWTLPHFFLPLPPTIHLTSNLRPKVLIDRYPTEGRNYHRGHRRRVLCIFLFFA